MFFELPLDRLMVDVLTFGPTIDTLPSVKMWEEVLYLFHILLWLFLSPNVQKNY